MSIRPSIVWFRQDLRLEDQPALQAAIEKGGAVIPLFIWAPEEEAEWAPGAASRWWLHHSLLNLQEELKKLGSSLIIRQGPSLAVLHDLIEHSGADAIFWNRRYEPVLIERDAFIKADLRKHGFKASSFNSHLLYEPWNVLNKDSKPFQVFTPFWKKCLLTEPPLPLTKPATLKPYIGSLASDSLEHLELLPKIHWDTGLQTMWQPGSVRGKAMLIRALENVIPFYHERRDRLDVEESVSHLSPYLRHGELSPRLIWHAVKEYFASDHLGAQAFLRQLGWREFGYHLLYHFSYTTHDPLKKEFKTFPWEHNAAFLSAWHNGQTGYPLVDAGMRQLWKTGWMHNRARLVVGSFLVKDLLINWTEGTKWFWDTLVDADLANNTLGWQWVGGCGADAAPYFRIFNPTLQGEKFDPEGAYVRRWVPELAELSNKWIHKPWEAPDEVLRAAGIELGVHYPKPIINHEQAREKALVAYGKR